MAISSATKPGGALKVKRSASPAPIRVSNSTVPSFAVALTRIDATRWLRGGVAPDSHVTVTLVSPSGPRDMPIHGRMYGLECEGRNGGAWRGTAAFASAAASFASGAQYPERARARRPVRLIFTCTG